MAIRFLLRLLGNDGSSTHASKTRIEKEVKATGSEATYWNRHVLQPVLLLGPREVGKSSLVRMLTDSGGQHQRTTDILDSAGVMTLTESYHFERHEQDPDNPRATIKVKVIPGLRFIDIPGEVGLQQRALSVAADSARDFWQRTKSGNGSGKGITIVCLFSGDSNDEARVAEYYAPGALDGLLGLVKKEVIVVDQIVFVFNKFDRWRAGLNDPTLTPNEMRLAFCDKYRSVITQLNSLSLRPNNDLETQSVATVLGQTAIPSANRKFKETGYHDVNVGFTTAIITSEMCQYANDRRKYMSQ